MLKFLTNQDGLCLMQHKAHIHVLDICKQSIPSGRTWKKTSAINSGPVLTRFIHIWCLYLDLPMLQFEPNTAL